MGLWSFWLILGVAFLVAELFTLSTTCLYIAAGAIGAMICALCGYGWIPCILTLVGTTAVLYIATYHWRHKLTGLLHKGAGSTATGMDALIGRTGVVKAGADSLRMRIDGDLWQVRPARHSAELKPGSEVRVVGYDSIVLIVENINS